MHVDGFRFDLASALARELHEVDKLGAFFDIIHQDPVLSQVKLIAEPWDLGEGGYQVGNFPVRLGRVERQVPRRGPPLLAGRRRARSRELATRLAGSSDLYEHERPAARTPASTSSPAHDGFTLHDLVSYNDKHNEANGEDNRDGDNEQPQLELRRRRPDRRPGRSTRCASGRSATSWPRCCSRRACRCSLAGDEIGRTQQRQQQRLLPGQRDQLARLGARRRSSSDLLDFTRAADRTSARRSRCLRRRTFFQGRGIRGADIKDIVWLDPDGQRDDRRGLERAVRALPGRAPGRRRDRRGRRARRARSATTRC